MAKQTYIGAGEVFAGPADGSGALRYLGQNHELKVSISEKTIELEDMDSPAGGTYDSVRRIEKVEVTMTLRDLSPANLAMALFGEASTTAAGTITDELTASAYAGGLLRLANINPTNVTAKSQNGTNAGDWAASTTYALGDYVVPPTPNGRFYQCTVAGDSAAGEPTWPTTSGGTVVDADVTWTDMGLIELVVNTDFTLSRAGLLMADLPTNLEEGAPLLVTYDHVDAEEIQGMVNSGKVLRMVFEGVNTANDDSSRIVDLFQVRFGPTSDLSLKGNEFGSITLTGSLQKDTSITGTGLSQYYKETIEA